MLDALRDADAPASFFVWGEQTTTPYQGSLVARARTEGHWIGSHGWNAVPLDDMSEAEVGDALTDTDGAVRDASCVLPRMLRPVRGQISDERRAFVEARGYTVVTWNADPQDYLEGTTVDSILAATAEHIAAAQRGDVESSTIQLLHDNVAVTATAIPQLVALIRGSGYTLVTMDECLYGRGVSSLRDFQLKDCVPRCGDHVCHADAGEDECVYGAGGSASLNFQLAACPAVCGDGQCDAERETCGSCAADCGSCGVCGDGVCDDGEAAVCPADCPSDDDDDDGGSGNDDGPQSKAHVVHVSPPLHTRSPHTNGQSQSSGQL